MKHFSRIVIIGAILLFLIACHKEKRGPSNLNSGNGIWQVEAINWIAYDTLGNETNDSTITNPGEFVFLKTHWGTSRTFMGKYVHYDSLGMPQATYPLDYNSDGKKLTINGTFPAPLAGFFSIERNGKINQRWIGLTYYFDQSIPNRIRERITISLKKGNR